MWGISVNGLHIFGHLLSSDFDGVIRHFFHPSVERVMIADAAFFKGNGAI